MEMRVGGNARQQVRMPVRTLGSRLVSPSRQVEEARLQEGSLDEAELLTMSRTDDVLIAVLSHHVQLRRKARSSVDMRFATSL